MAHHSERMTFGRMQNPIRGFLHGTAAVASVLGAIVLWWRCAGDPARQVTLLVFTVSLVALYTVSSLYHSVPWRRVWKERMQRLDHSMIYIVIAASYTPLAGVALDGWLRSAALGAAWGIALVGILQKVCVPQVGDWFSIAMQTFQGWLALPLLVPLAQRLPGAALLLTVLGGVFYFVGLVFLVSQRPRLWPRVFSYHEVFHIFVVAGSAAHYGMVFWYLAPFAQG
jgi:hemolysin III